MKKTVELMMTSGNGLLHPKAGLTDRTAIEKGQLSQLGAMMFFIAQGWEVSRPESDISSYDLLVTHPRTHQVFRVQIKTVGKERAIETYATGSGNLKGEKRKRVSYEKSGIDWIIGVDIAQLRVHLYPLDFYRNRQSINVDKNASHVFPYVADGRTYNNKKDKTLVTLDNL